MNKKELLELKLKLIAEYNKTKDPNFWDKVKKEHPEVVDEIIVKNREKTK
jgi:hypothetical protein